MYSSTLSLTSVLDVVGDQRHAPATLPSEKNAIPMYKRLWGPRASLDGCVNFFPADLRTVKPIASRCTDWAILAHECVSVVLVIRYTNRKCSIVICSLPRCAIYFHINGNYITFLYNVLYTVSTQQYIITVIKYIQSGHITATCFDRKRSSSGQ